MSFDLLFLSTLDCSMSLLSKKVWLNRVTIFRSFLYITAVVLIVFFFPRGGKFKFEFQKGKPWQYEDYFAPFDFSIQKTEQEIALEKQNLLSEKEFYFTKDTGVVYRVFKNFKQHLTAKQPANNKAQESATLRLLSEFYAIGVFDTLIDGKKMIWDNGITSLYTIKEAFYAKNIPSFFKDTLHWRELKPFIEPNLLFDERLTERAYQQDLAQISYTKGNVPRGKLLISKGKVVEEEDYQTLISLVSEYESNLWQGTNLYFIIFGYAILVALVLGMLLLFLKNYRKELFEGYKALIFIFFNLVLMVLLSTLVVKKIPEYTYIVPLCMLPLILKNFFDARLGLFVHVLTVLILGFVVPNSLEYIFLQIMAGVVTILSVSELHKRANLFISVGQITFIYIVGYFAFHLIHEGQFSQIDWFIPSLFLLNGMLTLFAFPLIYLYEKVFGLVSDVSLLELSDTNSKLLKRLAENAPGTFYHSLQVANLAEAAAGEIGANAMLVRVGALYHDIGKLAAPTFFTENQANIDNPHQSLTPYESAEIIINHVKNGVEMAKKEGLPEVVIDFIKTHHGTSTVQYFYHKQLQLQEEVSLERFQYPGPKPTTKEMAILMMTDAIEAASKSLKNPTSEQLFEFVEKIINHQMEDKQFAQADITFKEISKVKGVLKQKLLNIYHIRVAYPK